MIDTESPHDPTLPLPPLPSEELLIDVLRELHASGEAIAFERCLVASPGRAQSGSVAKTLCPTGRVTCWYVDAFRAARSIEYRDAHSLEIDIVCSPDLPPESVELALVPVLQRGEAEMTRDVLQAAHVRLAMGGRMIASVNHPRDRWLREQMQAIFDKVTCKQFANGWAYIATKRSELKKVKSFDAEFPFRDGDATFRVLTRPSVFSHRSLDVAARQLINHGEVAPGDNVLDLGCGSGPVALAAARRSASGVVYAIDSNARAVDCVRRSAELNLITNVVPIVNHDGRLPEVLPCDVALLNPPYYGDFTIAEHFVSTATELLKVGGRIVVVTKQRDAYHARPWAKLLFEREIQASGYQLLTYRKRIE